MAKVGKIDPRGLLGQRVAVAYNLNNCRIGKPPKLGEVCYSVRPLRKSGTPGSPVLGWVPSIVLKDAVPYISEATLRAIRTKVVRSVCCYVIGTVVAKAGPGRQQPAGFNPYKASCFYVRSPMECLERARFAIFKARTMWVVGPTTTPLRNTGSRRRSPVERQFFDFRVPNSRLGQE